MYLSVKFLKFAKFIVPAQYCVYPPRSTEPASESGDLALEHSVLSQ